MLISYLMFGGCLLLFVCSVGALVRAFVDVWSLAGFLGSRCAGSCLLVSLLAGLGFLFQGVCSLNSRESIPFFWL